MMHCSDLERYLEACLDGQLGDDRRQSLKQHLAMCRSCSERVDSLRRFEADLQRRLRAMQHEASLWRPLGLEVVGDGEQGAFSDTPPAVPAASRKAAKSSPARQRTKLPVPAGRPPANHRLSRAGTVSEGPGKRRLQTLAGLALLVAAAGALANFALGTFGSPSGERPLAMYRAYLAGSVALDMHTNEPNHLASWMGERLGEPVAVPEAVSGFELIGGKAGLRDMPDGAAMAVYETEAGPAVLMIEQAKAGALPQLDQPSIAVEDGVTQRAWQQGDYAYSLISALPLEKLALFPTD